MIAPVPRPAPPLYLSLAGCSPRRPRQLYRNRVTSGLRLGWEKGGSERRNDHREAYVGSTLELRTRWKFTQPWLKRVCVKDKPASAR